MATLPNIKVPIAVRPKTSDEPLLQSIFGNQEYALPIKEFKPKFIVDCGANVGYASIYFANQYPEAKIIAVEPELLNYKMLTFNTHFYDNIRCVRSAMWDKETFIEVKDVGLGAWGFMTFETTAENPNALQTTTVSRLLSDSGFDEIDLLKVDVEGAEKEMFGAADVHDWLSKTKVIMIEQHDRMKRGCAMAIFGAVSKYNFFFTQRGENLIFVREDLLS